MMMIREGVKNPVRSEEIPYGWGLSGRLSVFVGGLFFLSFFFRFFRFFNFLTYTLWHFCRHISEVFFFGRDASIHPYPYKESENDGPDSGRKGGVRGSRASGMEGPTQKTLPYPSIYILSTHVDIGGYASIHFVIL